MQPPGNVQRLKSGQNPEEIQGKKNKLVLKNIIFFRGRFFVDFRSCVLEFCIFDLRFGFLIKKCIFWQLERSGVPNFEIFNICFYLVFPMFSPLELGILHFCPQIRIPHEKLYIYIYIYIATWECLESQIWTKTLRNPDPEQNLVFSYQMHKVYNP